MKEPLRASVAKGIRLWQTMTPEQRAEFVLGAEAVDDVRLAHCAWCGRLAADDDDVKYVPGLGEWVLVMHARCRDAAGTAGFMR